MKRYYIIIILLLCLSSCIVTKKRASKKIAKYVENYPSLIVHDTIKFVDTIPFVIKEVRHDTIIEQSVDSVVIKKDRLTIKYVKRDSVVYLSGECESDTIWEIVHKEVVVPSVKIQNCSTNRNLKLLIVFAAVVILGYVIKKVLK